MVASCHEILGLSRDATPEQVEAAYLAAALRAHPDHYPEGPARTVAAERFRAAGEAYRVLVAGMSIGGDAGDRDARARQTCEAALARVAARLAGDGSRVGTVADRLTELDCPPALAWRFAEQTVMARRLARARAAALADQAEDDPADGSGPPRILGESRPGRPTDPRDAADPDPRGSVLRARAAAASADALLLGGLVGVPVALLAWRLGASPADMQRAALAALLLAGTAYQVGAETRWGATFGKRLFGLRVTATNGRRVDPGCALARHCVRTIAHFTMGLPFLVAFLDERRQAPQELLTASRVRWDGVDRSELERPLAALPFVALALWALYRLLVPS